MGLAVVIFGIHLCIDDTDDKSSAWLEGTMLSVDDQQEAREEEGMDGSDTEETCMLAFLASWCLAARRLSFLFLFSSEFLFIIWMLNW